MVSLDKSKVQTNSGLRLFFVFNSVFSQKEDFPQRRISWRISGG
jgi:hypothetical protein